MAETVIFCTERALFLFWVTKKLDLSFLPEHQIFQDFQFGGKRRGWAGGFVLDGALKDPLVHYWLLILSTAPLDALITGFLISKHLTIYSVGGQSLTSAGILFRIGLVSIFIDTFNIDI